MQNSLETRLNAKFETAIIKRDAARAEYHKLVTLLETLTHDRLAFAQVESDCDMALIRQQREYDVAASYQDALETYRARRAGIAA